MPYMLEYTLRYYTNTDAKEQLVLNVYIPTRSGDQQLCI